MTTIIIKPLTEKGRRAILTHTIEKERENLKDKLIYRSAFDEKIEDNQLKIRVRSQSIYLIDLEKFKGVIHKTMKANGAENETDYTLKEV